MSIRDVMDEGLPPDYKVIDLEVDFQRILRNKELLKGMEFEAERRASDCSILPRHERPKAVLSRNGQEMDSLFFALSDDDEDGRRGVAVQQCLDSVHQYLEHRESIDIQLLAESVAADTESADKGEATDFDVDALCEDRLVIALDREIEERRASGRSRGRGIEQEQFNKFMTTNSYISTATKPLTATLTLDDHKQRDDAKESEEEIECELCFVEQLQNELLLHSVPKDTVYALSRYLVDNHFDTDSVVADSDGPRRDAKASSSCSCSNIKNLIRSLSAHADSDRESESDIDIDRVIDRLFGQNRAIQRRLQVLV